MIIWILLFLLVITISFILALRSLRHYRERPVPAKMSQTFGLFLIQRPENLTPDILIAINKELVVKQSAAAFERLFKGERQVLVVYGPRNLLTTFSTQLGLLELEDFSAKSYPHSLAFEVGETANGQFNPGWEGLSAHQLGLNPKDELWWQVVFKPQPPDGERLDSVIRVVISSQEDGLANSRLAEIQGRLLLTIQEANLTRLPQAHPSPKIKEFYQNRSLFNLFSSSKEHLILDASSLRKLLGVN